jgi:hypothetical protein
MDTCAYCHRPIENRGFFIDRNTGVTMHTSCLVGQRVEPLRHDAPYRLPAAAPVSDKLAA